MLPFVGEYLHSIDKKGRLIIPSKFRNNFGEKIYLCKGFEECLLILTPEEIEKIETKIQGNSLTRKEIREFTRTFFSGMTEASFDSQGRIIISNGLKQYAHLEEEAYVVGTGFYVEIWDKKIWDEGIDYRDNGRSELAVVLEGLDD